MENYPKPTVQQAVDSWKVVLDLIELGYPHNFQHEAPWVVDYLYKLTTIIKKADNVKNERRSEKKAKQNEVERDC